MLSLYLTCILYRNHEMFLSCTGSIWAVKLHRLDKFLLYTVTDKKIVFLIHVGQQKETETIKAMTPLKTLRTTLVSLKTTNVYWCCENNFRCCSLCDSSITLVKESKFPGIIFHSKIIFFHHTKTLKYLSILEKLLRGRWHHFDQFI